MKQLLERVRERHIVAWTLGYAGFGAILYDVLGNASDSFGWPPVILKLITVALVAGLFAVMVVSWYHGEKGQQKLTLPEVALAAVAWTVLLVQPAPPDGGLGREVAAPPAASRSDSAGDDHTVIDDLSEGYVASLAVLPLEVISTEPGDRELAAGLSEALTTRLQTVPEVKVIHRPSVLDVVARMPRPLWADTMNVGHFLEGTWQRLDDTIRVTLHLVEARTGEMMWSQPYELSSARSLADQDALAGAVSRLVAQLGGDFVALGDAYAVIPAAHDAYLQGQNYSRLRTREGLIEAMHAFRRAAELDEGYARAYAALSSQFVLWVTYDYEGFDPYQAYAWAIALARHALELQPELPEAQLAWGFALSKAWGPADMAISAFEEAVHAIPGSADVLGWYAYLLAREHRHQESVDIALRAAELDPFTPGRDVGLSLDALAALQYGLAYGRARRAGLLGPELALPTALKGFGLLLQGRVGECLELDLSRYPAIEAMCLHSVGREEEGRALVGSLIDDVEEGAHPSYIEAYFAWTDQPERALEWLDRSYRRTPNGTDFRIIETAVFDPIRDATGLDSWLADMRGRIWQDVLELSHDVDVRSIALPNRDLGSRTSRPEVN